MSIPVVYAHGAGAGPADPPWPELSAALGPGYDVAAPDLGPPDAARWSRLLAEAVRAAPSPPLLIGHSLGGSHLLKLAAELGPAVPIRGVIALAAPCWGEPDWVSEDFALPDWAGMALARVPVRLFHARDDEVVPFAHLAALARRLPDARCRPVAGGGHEFSGGLAPVGMAAAEL